MTVYFYVYVELFFPFAFQAVYGAFAVFKATTGKLDDLVAADELVVYQYLIFLYPDTVNPDVETLVSFHLEPAFFIEIPTCDNGNRYRYDNSVIKPFYLILSREYHVHTKEGCYQP